MDVASAFDFDCIWHRGGIDSDRMVSKAMRSRLPYIIVIITMALGCESVGPVDKPVRREWPQKCEMCGASWLVTPSKLGETVPPTVEWCFNDGSYCDIGLDMIIDAGKNGETPEGKRKWLNHCIGCKGCRCAAFDPDEWRKVTDAIKKVRQRSRFEAMTDEELESLAGRQAVEAIGLSPIAIELSKRKDAQSAKEELSRRDRERRTR